MFVLNRCTLAAVQVVVLWVCAVAALADTLPTYRELPCRVVDENGNPARDTKVFLDDVDRFSGQLPQNNSDSDVRPAWRFTTDNDGRFTVRFGRFDALKQGEATGTNEPGYGRFHLVAIRDGFAGGVSPRILNLNDAALAERKARASASGGNDADAGEYYQEWLHGEFAPYVLADTPPRQPLVIVLKRGLKVWGQMLDPAGRPLPGVTVNAWSDLHADTHTGYGGEIFEQKTVTDENGRFRFPQVYPNVFTLGLPGENQRPLYWIRTRVRDHWANRIEDVISPRLGTRRHPANYENSIRIRMILAEKPPYRYFGRVTDRRGQGIAGMKVLLQASAHSPAVSYSDNHSSQSTLTDAHGDYSLQVGSRFVNWIQVRAEENTYDPKNEISAKGDALLPPGRYNFKVSP